MIPQILSNGHFYLFRWYFASKTNKTWLLIEVIKCDGRNKSRDQEKELSYCREQVWTNKTLSVIKFGKNDDFYSYAGLIRREDRLENNGW